MIEHAEDILAMARLFEEQGQYDMAIQLYLRGMQADLPDEIMIDASTTSGAHPQAPG